MGRCPDCNSLESIRRELHDQIGSPLAALLMEIQLAQQLVKQRNLEGADEVLTDARDDIVEIMAQIRQIISDTDNSQNGRWEMEEALRTMLRRMNRVVAPQRKISLRIDPGIRAVAGNIGRTAFWIIREAVINVLKHSTARNCLVVLYGDGRGLYAVVRDDGYLSRQPQNRSGHGISNMTARAKGLGGWCIAGPASGGGFIVTAYLPYHQEPSGSAEPSEDYGRFSKKSHKYPNCR